MVLYKRMEDKNDMEIKDINKITTRHLKRIREKLIKEEAKEMGIKFMKKNITNREGEQDKEVEKAAKKEEEDVG